MAEILTTYIWTLISGCPIPDDIRESLAKNEEAIAAYQTVLGSVVFTSKRLIAKDTKMATRDYQNNSGERIKEYHLPYSSINMWCMEAKDNSEFLAEYEFYTKACRVKINLREDVELDKFNHMLATYLLEG